MRHSPKPLGLVQPSRKAARGSYLGDHWRARIQHQWHFGEMKAGGGDPPGAWTHETACGLEGSSGSERSGTAPAPPPPACGWTPDREKETKICVGLIQKLFKMFMHFTRFTSMAFSDQRDAALMDQRIMMKFTVLCLLARICMTTVLQPRSAKMDCVCKNGSSIFYFSLLEDPKWLRNNFQLCHGLFWLM